MNTELKPIPLPPALVNKTKRPAYFRAFVIDQLKLLKAKVESEVAAAAGPDVAQCKQWELEGVNRALKAIQRTSYRGRKWRI
jgi:hypothetical protein